MTSRSIGNLLTLRFCLYIHKDRKGVFDVIAGILDIYGFECFAYNSLEQLCINYANEKLQQHFVKHFLKEIQDEYANEALPWTEVTYSDNTECVNLLESNPGIFAILNEVSWVHPREFG